MKLLFCDIAPDTHSAVTTLVADSAMVRLGQPVFLPSFADAWQGAVMPAVRISRLGLAIEERFASRYYDAVAAIHRLWVPGHEAPADAMLATFDGAVAPGEWLPLDVLDGPDPLLECGAQAVPLVGLKALADKAVAHLASRITLRNGDIIALSRLALPVSPAPDLVVQASIGGRNSLKFKFK